ncbi:MAG: chemotaxis protein CheA [Archaeoglobaceae archaeon]
MDHEYTEVFVEESKSLLTDLNNLLLELEEEPHNVDVMTSIFRNAHTLKGNSAAMGFDNLSETAHAIEDLLDALRQGKTEMDNHIMNLIFEGADMIELLLGEIVEAGRTTTQPDELINRIRIGLEDQCGEGSDSQDPQISQNPQTQEDSQTSQDHPKASTGQQEFQEVSNEETDSISADRVNLKVKVNPDSQMKGIDAMLIIKNIEEIAEMVSTTPSVDQIEDGSFEDWFEVVLGGSVEKVQELMGKLPQIKEYKLDVEQSSEEDQGEVQSSEEGSEESKDVDKEAQKRQAQEQRPQPNNTNNSRAKVKHQDIQSIRIGIHKLDELMNMVEELVVRKLKLENSLPPEVKKTIGDEFSNFERILSRLQDTVMDLRLIPLKYVVDRLPRIVRDLSKSLGKEVNFVVEGKEVTVDRTVLDKIQDPLVHIVRNSVDHGIETPEVRENAGKDRVGNLTLTASKLKDHVLIEITDDGKGLDSDKIKGIALEKGLVSEEEVEGLSQEEIYNLILMPGFSTSEQVTDVSGRGVGTDIIQNTVKSLGGSVEVISQKGKGTTFKLRLPLSMAISQILLVTVKDEKYGIPLKDILKVEPVSNCEIRYAGGTDQLVMEESIIPVIHLKRTLGVDHEANSEKMIVIASSVDKRVALACDSVLDQKEVVVKSLGMLKSVEGISGISILGEGEVVPILDINTLGGD